MTNERIRKWSSHQRKRFKEGNIESWKIKLLNSRGFIFESPYRNYITFKDARKFVWSLKLKTAREYYIYLKNNKPNNIPYHPNRIYKNCGWISFNDWLGIRPGFKRCNYISFQKAKEYVRCLNLKSRKEWIEWYKKNKPNNIPLYPNQVYKKLGWRNMYDFLGKRERIRNFKSYNKCKQFIHRLKLKNKLAWDNYLKRYKLPNDIPRNPYGYYSKTKEWLSWGDYLGTFVISTKKLNFLPFNDAREFVRNLNLKNTTEWKIWSKTKRPKNIPGIPKKSYKDEYISIGNWLGTHNISNKLKEFLSYDDAKKFTHSLGLESVYQWEKYKKNRPSNIPSNPKISYKNKGWVSWPDFLGKNVYEFNRIS